MTPDIIAGVISTSMFASGNVPMLLKALRTRSLSSYSHTQLMVNSTANLVHWLYVSGLPFGPIWFLHSFHTVSTALMLVWYMRFEGSRVGFSVGGALSRLALWRRPVGQLAVAGLGSQQSLELDFELSAADVFNLERAA